MREEGFGPSCRVRAADPKSAHSLALAGSGPVAPAPARTEPHPKRIGHVTKPHTRFRFQFRAARRCRYEQCYRLFVATARDLVFCSARCGRAARGYDESGKRLSRGAA
jgi:hypothetical protein